MFRVYGFRGLQARDFTVSSSHLPKAPGTNKVGVLRGPQVHIHMYIHIICTYCYRCIFFHLFIAHTHPLLLL